MLGLGYSEASSRSAGTVRIVRRRAAELNLDWSHFRGKRRWSDAQLRRGVANSTSWQELVTKLGLSSGSGNVQPHLKAHTIRLGLDTRHLNAVSHVSRQPGDAVPAVSLLDYEPTYLRLASESIAAAWFTLRGCTVSIPAIPAAYDLLVETPEGLRTVQVKTTTHWSKYGWSGGIGHHPDKHSKKGQVLAYDPDEIDLFFIMDGDLTIYLIPSRAVAGRISIVLRTYRKYIVGNGRALLAEPPTVRDLESAARAPREPVPAG